MLFQQIINTQITETFRVPFFHMKPLKPNCTPCTDSTSQFGAAVLQVLSNACAHCIDSVRYRFPWILKGIRAKVDRKLFTPFPPPASKRTGLFPPLRILRVPPLQPSMHPSLRPPLGLKQVQEAEHTDLMWRAGTPGKIGHLSICPCWRFC